MKYVTCLTLILSISACAKKKAIDPPFVVANMECTAPSVQILTCATPDGVAQVKPVQCYTSFSLGTGATGVPLEATGRTVTGSVAVANAWDCGAHYNRRCFFIEFTNGWQDLRCDLDQLP